MIPFNLVNGMFFFADERFVPLDDPECNYKLCKDTLLNKVPIPENQIYKIDVSQQVEDAARLYQRTLKETFGYFSPKSLPKFDLILLGMGPDGHTASLFPHHPALKETEHWVLPIKDSPKPPPQRITLTLPILNSAVNVIFVCTGEAKSESLKGVLESKDSDVDKYQYPSRLIIPASNNLFWYVDIGAASKLTKKTSLL